MGLWVEGVTGGVMGSCGEKFVMAGVVGDAHCRRRLVNAPEQALRLAVALMWRTRARDEPRRMYTHRMKSCGRSDGRRDETAEKDSGAR